MKRARMIEMIRLLEKDQKLGREAIDMKSWQSGQSAAAGSLEVLHACGNRACIAGYVALLPTFKRIGGGNSSSGMPVLHRGCREEEVSGADAVSEFFGWSVDLAEMLCCTPDYWTMLCGEQKHPQTAREIKEAVEGKDWWRWGAKEVIIIFKALLDGRIVDFPRKNRRRS